MSKHYLEESYKKRNRINSSSDIPLIYPRVINIEIGEEIPDEWTNKIIDLVMEMRETQDSNKYSIYISKGTKDKNIQTYVLY